MAAANHGGTLPGVSRSVGAKADHVPRLLIVEDELFVAWHLEAIARDLSLEVCGLVADGEGAIEQAADLEPDLMLMDIRLAGKMDGVEAARRIRSKQAMPIIFITAFTDKATLDRIAHDVPGAAVLAKPVSAERLRTAIAGLIPGAF